MTTDSAAYDAVIADVEAKRDRLTGIIDALKELKALGIPMVAVNGIVGNPNITIGATIPHDAFFGMTIPDAARKYLSIVKQTKPHPELCDALLEGGFQSRSENFREVVRSTLGRNPDFVKIKGQWGLKEWYGNRMVGTKRQKKATAESQPQQDAEASPASAPEAEEPGK